MTVPNTGLFSQILAQVPRGDFSRLVAKHKAERHAKGFSCWDQFVAMLFCHLAHAESLREIHYGLRSCGGKLRHLGLKRVPARSTLSYANAHRTPELYRDLFYFLLHRLRAQDVMPGRHRFDFRNKLLSFDATINHLSLRMYPWSDFNRTKGGLKVNVVLDHADYLPQYVHISKARQHDVQYARSLSLPRGSIVLLDKGYINLAMFSRWNDQGVFFITPQKKHLCYRVVSAAQVPAGGTVISDEIIALSGDSSSRKYKQLLRRVVLEVEDREGGKRLLALMTNLTDQEEFDAATIGESYKERWQIEIFFKTLKQNLVLKDFVGANENALTIQIWTALIAMLLMRWLYYKSQRKRCFSTLVAVLRLNLFTHRDLQDFLHDPWAPPPNEEEPVQMVLTFADLDSRLTETS